MRIRYYVSAESDALYGEGHLLYSRYKTYGQHSFIVDFARCAIRQGVAVDFVIERLDLFPIAAPLARTGPVVDLTRQADLPDRVDGVVLDVVNDAVLPCLPDGVPAVSIVHRARQTFSPGVVERSARFVAMTPNAVAIQSERVGPERLVLITQGVDLERFRPSTPEGRDGAGRPDILWYTRLNPAKRPVLVDAIERILRASHRLTLLGDGQLFWELSDLFGEDLALVNFVPCHSIQNYLRGFDVVISSGRGVMEALASGIPAICAGFGYGGLVRPSNVESLLRYNLTGWRLPADFDPITDDIEQGRAMAPSICRGMAERYLDGDSTVRSVVRILADLGAS